MRRACWTVTLDETSGEELSAFARPQAERVLTEQTAATLHTMLEQTVAEGTAQDASGLPGGAAGKTGTAQTGQFTAEGKELKNLWFAGFYPAEDPQYTIVVLQDGQTQAAGLQRGGVCTAVHGTALVGINAEFVLAFLADGMILYTCICMVVPIQI